MRPARGPNGAVPRWASALLSAHRALELAHSQRVAATLEVLRVGVPASARAPITDAIFARQRTYAPGGQRFAEALHDWEQAALEHPAWPRAGRVLVGGAGGGRELAALADRGYEVSAFEPSGLADDLARAAAAAPTPCEALRGDYADLVRALTLGDGPLRPFGAPARFDAVVLGWASLSHVLEPADRRALPRVARGVAARAGGLHALHGLHLPLHRGRSAGPRRRGGLRGHGADDPLRPRAAGPGGRAAHGDRVTSAPRHPRRV